MTDNERIKNCMEKLDISYDEAVEMLEYDKQVDKMTMAQINATMTKEEKAIIKKMTQADRKPTVYKFDKKNRKENATKAELIAELYGFLGDKVENIEIINKEKLISFEFNGEKFELNLVQKRKPKN